MNSSLTVNKLASLALCLFAAYFVMLLPAEALAGGVFSGGGSSDSGVIGGLLCRVAKWFTGSVGKGIATLAIIVIGIGALMGKVSWGMAIIVGLGVAIIFGAPQIVGELSADGRVACNTSGGSGLF